MPSAAVPVPRLRDVRKGLAEVLSPVAALQAELTRSWPVEIDKREAKRRVRAGRPAFDAIEALQAAGDLRRRFVRATQAFERAGLTTSESAQTVRQQTSEGVLTLAVSWVTGEPLPRQEPRRLAQRAAGLVAGSLLLRLATAVRATVRGATAARTTCPACGSSAEFSVDTAHGRRLVCARCDTAWMSPRPGCVGCDAHDAPTLIRIPSDVGYELLVCNGCGRYLKHRVGRGSSNLLVERALTAELDAAAERRGLRL